MKQENAVISLLWFALQSVSAVKKSRRLRLALNE